MRIAVIVLSIALVGAAIAQEAPPPAATETTPISATTEPAPPPPPATAKKKTRYVNEKGEELICKPVSGSTGTRLKGRGKLICGTQAEWDDSHSEVNELFDNLIQTNTPSPRG